MISRAKYDSQFSPQECRQIRRLRWLADNRKLLGRVSAAVIALLLLCWYSSLARHSDSGASTVFGAILPAALLTFAVVSGGIYDYTNRQFLTKWDPLFNERIAKSQPSFFVDRKVRALANNIEFVGLPIEEQRAIVAALKNPSLASQFDFINLPLDAQRSIVAALHRAELASSPK